jgi:hypothetical protein
MIMLEGELASLAPIKEEEKEEEEEEYVTPRL